ncbi:zinc-binding dehydrogenase [Pseudonocardia sp. GCM10023141]|uniref:zinc-binding dehydrogenase n=1 Tax=Pseudonocardia sp. GCM10023141 TaxID=3252653 RepID=UPI00362218AC
MLAGRLHLDDRRFAVEEVPVPEPGPDEVLIAVQAAGVCLSDVHLIDGTLRPSFNTAGVVTLGHEVAGVVHTVGSAVPAGWAPGTRVALQAGQTCGQCANCVRHRSPCQQIRTRGVDYDGGWAEFALARHDTLVAIPDTLPFDQASIIPDAVSTPYAAIVVTAGVRPAQSVGIWGVGGLGVHGVRVARLAGAAPIIAVDPLPGARERALAAGADVALDPTDPGFATAVAAATGGRGIDAAFDFAGVAAVRNQAATVLAPGGQLVLVGLTAEPITVANGTLFSFKGNVLRGHYGSGASHVEDLIRLAGSGRLDLGPSISAHIPLADAAAAVEQLEHKEGDPIRLILVP